ncbi:hypothetical protein MMC14_001247 [Varicellaria rhodocarpa]|nr:hypothetical protein [Varicellaria rhodocarpa]
MQFASIATLFLAAIATASPNSPPVSPRADFLAVSVDVTGTDATGARCTVSCVELAVVVAACAASFVDELATIASCAGVSTTSLRKLYY